MRANTILLLIENDTIIFLTIPQMGVLRSMKNRKSLNGAAIGIYFVNYIQCILWIMTSVTKLWELTFRHWGILQ